MRIEELILDGESQSELYLLPCDYIEQISDTLGFKSYPVRTTITGKSLHPMISLFGPMSGMVVFARTRTQESDFSGFDESFNAITGLNGSGKSNILDAICFVLGITNMTQVRASNLMDLIYKRYV
jgi:AAA15 family ATPase/GTPase